MTVRSGELSHTRCLSGRSSAVYILTQKAGILGVCVILAGVRPEAIPTSKQPPPPFNPTQRQSAQASGEGGEKGESPISPLSLNVKRTWWIRPRSLIEGIIVRRVRVCVVFPADGHVPVGIV